MTYHGKAVEILGSKEVFGHETLWIRILEDNSFHQILKEDLDNDENIPSNDLSLVRYTAIAARIKEEIAQKRLLAPYESSLIPLPHQILVLEKVMKADQNRFLLADEVGMGKTIEAGLVLKELKLRGEVKRTLLIVPKSAMIQWQSEMKEHFKESFHIYDSELISSLSKTFAGFDAEEELNFWQQHNQIIVSTDALKPIESRQGWNQEKIEAYNKYRLEAVLSAEFDMVIIDEAHRVGGSTAQVSRHQLAEALCNVIPNVLLLTATPHRGKSDHFRRILQLLDNDAFQGEGMPAIKEIEPYVIRSEKRFAVDYDGNKLFQPRTTHLFEVLLNEKYHAHQIQLYADVTDYVRYCFGKAKANGKSGLGMVLVMFQKLASSSTAAILSAMKTRLYRIQNALEDEVENYIENNEMHDDLEDVEMQDYFVEHTFLKGSEEDALKHLIEEAEYCIQHEVDAKAEALLQKINQLQIQSGERHLKILVFTEFRTTQRYLSALFQKRGITCAAINGSMDIDQRRRELCAFKDNVDVMIATDAAGESLNMQFCHIIFNYDMPWNPMMVEQRIGRVDRIGQENPVKAFNMLANNSIDCRVYDIVVQKLDTIMAELGIDKTSDVLDSTIDMKKTNQLYLQSLLDPRQIECSGEQWLREIRGKLREYKATEGALPTIPEEEIDKQSAAEIKYSPLPVWLEEMMDLYTYSNHGKVSKTTDGVSEYDIKGRHITAVFDSKIIANHPLAEHITLQCDIVKQILNAVDGCEQTETPIICSQNKNSEKGYFSIWKVTAQNTYSTKISYVAQFISDNGKSYGAYANEIWNKLVQEPTYYTLEGMDLPRSSTNYDLIMKNLQNIFSRLESEIRQTLQKKSEKKIRAIDFAIQRALKIGIPNIRNAKLKKLTAERTYWEEEFLHSNSIVPNVNHLITIRIDG